MNIPISIYWKDMFFILTFSLSLCLSILLTPLAKKMAVLFNIVDRPDVLKIHKTPIPYLGGVAIFGSFFLTGLFVLFSRVDLMPPRFITQFVSILIGAIFVFFIGLLDDINPLSPKIRLVGQFIASCILLFSVDFGIHFMPVIISVPLTIIYVMAMINAMNLLDGMDGLATGVSFIAGVAFIFVALLIDDRGLLLISALLMGATLGFLRFNFYPAKIFMGDSGSTFLGYVLAAMTIHLTSATNNFIYLVAAIIICGVPIFDVSFTVIRRLIKQRPLFQGDRGHFYDLLLERFSNQRYVCLFIYAIGLIFAFLGLWLIKI